MDRNAMANNGEGIATPATLPSTSMPHTNTAGTATSTHGMDIALMGGQGRQTRSTKIDIHSNVPNHAMVQRLELKKSSSLPDFLKAAAVKSVLTHILFSRGVIPCPAGHLLKKVQAYDGGRVGLNGLMEAKGDSSGGGQANYSESFASDSTSIAVAATRIVPVRRKRADIIRERKYEKHGLQIQSVLHDIETIFGVNTGDDQEEIMNANASVRSNTDSKTSNRNIVTMEDSSGIKAVLITLGPSFHSPREQYILRFHSWLKRGCSRTCKSDTSNRSRNDNNDGIPRPIEAQIPLSTQKKLQQEIGRRCVRELINGSLEEEHCKMFEARGGGVNGQNSSIKVNIACLLRADAVEALLNPKSDTLPDAGIIRREIGGSCSHDGIESPYNNASISTAAPHATSPQYPTSFQPFAPYSSTNSRLRFTIHRNLELKQPRMFSKSRGIHRPFVVLDIIPVMKPPYEKTYTCLHDKCGSKNNSPDDPDDDDMDISMDMDNDGDDELQGHGCIHEDGDTWIALRSFVKGFRA